MLPVIGTEILGQVPPAGEDCYTLRISYHDTLWVFALCGSARVDLTAYLVVSASMPGSWSAACRRALSPPARRFRRIASGARRAAVVDKDLCLRRLKFSEAICETNDELVEDPLARADADFLILCDIFQQLQSDLVGAFCGIAE